MFRKDTYRLIKKTSNRFIAILMICLIGVAFMMGLFSCRTIMEESVDRYNDAQKLQDVQLYSSYGFDDNDVAELRKQDFVDNLFASKMTDVMSQTANGHSSVTRVEELTRNINLYELVEGSYPQDAREVLVLDTGPSAGYYRIGDTIKVYLEDEDVLEKLKYDEYIIVGKVRSSSYMSLTLGTSMLKNMELDTIIYTYSSNFLSEYYTTIYLTVKDAEAFDAFTRKYDVFMEDAIGDITVFAGLQQDKLKDRLLGEYRAKIAQGEAELEEKKAEGQKKLDDAKAQLDDAYIQIVAAENNIETMRSVIKTVYSRQIALENQYGPNARATYARIEEIENNDPQGRSFDEIYAEVLRDYSTYNALKSASDGTIDQQISELNAENSSLRDQLNALQSERDQLQAQLEQGDLSVQDRIAKIDSEITEIRIQIEVNNRLISTMESMSSSTNAQARMKALEEKYDGKLTETYQEYSALQQDKVLYDALKEEINTAQQAMNRINTEISAMEEQIASGKRQYQAGKREYDKGVIEFNIQIEKAEADIRKAYQDLDELPEAKWMILDRDSHYSTFMFANNARQMGAIGMSMPFLFYLVAALVCMTTMTRLVDEQRGQIGVFRALGFSKSQIIGKYVTYALLATVIGSVIGIFLGMMIFPTVIYNTWRLMYDLPAMKLYFPPRFVIICILAFTALMSGVTYLVVNATLKEMPSQLLRPKAPKNAKKVFLEKIGFIWRRLSFTSKVTARNLIRYKMRFFMTVIGVAGCTGLLVIGWGIKDSIADVVNLQYGQIFNYDYTVNLENDKSCAEMVENLKSNLDNELVTEMMTYASKVYIDKEPTINVIVVDAREGSEIFKLRATNKKDELKIKNTGVIISEKFARNHDLKKGDMIVIESTNGIKAQVKISEICEMYFQHYLFISEDYYRAIFDEPVHATSIAVKNSTGTIDVSSIKELEGYASVTDFSSLINQFAVMIEALNYIILVIILTAGSLAFVVLTNLTQVNISERVREIATLKVLGFRRREVYSYIFKEIMLLSVIGGLIGLPLGVLEHHFIMNIISMEMVMFGMTLKLPTYLYAYGITIVFTVIVMSLTRKSLHNVEMIESLKSVE